MVARVRPAATVVKAVRVVRRATPAVAVQARTAVAARGVTGVGGVCVLRGRSGRLTAAASVLPVAAAAPAERVALAAPRVWVAPVRVVPPRRARRGMAGRAGWVVLAVPVVRVWPGPTTARARQAAMAVRVVLVVRRATLAAA